MIHDMNWMQVEAYLDQDDRTVVPLGSTEQHAYLSLGVDNLLAERVALEAAEPLGVPVFPTVKYGMTPYFLAYPGTISLRLATYQNLLLDLLDSLATNGTDSLDRRGALMERVPEPPRHHERPYRRVPHGLALSSSASWALLSNRLTHTGSQA